MVIQDSCSLATLHLMWQSLSPEMKAKLFNPLPDIWERLEVWFIHSSKTLALIKYCEVDSSSCCVTACRLPLHLTHMVY